MEEDGLHFLRRQRRQAQGAHPLLQSREPLSPGLPRLGQGSAAPSHLLGQKEQRQARAFLGKGKVIEAKEGSLGAPALGEAAFQVLGEGGGEVVTGLDQERAIGAQRLGEPPLKPLGDQVAEKSALARSRGSHQEGTAPPAAQEGGHQLTIDLLPVRAGNPGFLL